MSLLEHSVLWAKGEVFEASIVAAAGSFFFVISLLSWMFGSTAGVKAFILPLVIVGAIFLAAGASSIYSNSKKVNEFKTECALDSQEFAKSEKKRVEDFQYLYKYTQWMAILFFIVTIATQLMSASPQLKAVGITLAIIAVAGLLIDYFSKERADQYYSEILQYSK